MQKKKINRKESSALLGSLTSGVVPRIGLRHIAVGRKREVSAFLNDLTTIEDGGAAFRLVTGNYGSGKSFLLQMIRNYAMEKNFVVADADFSPERRLTGSKGQGLAIYRELMQHLSIAQRQDGGALDSVLQKWIVTLQRDIAIAEQFQPDDPRLVEAVSDRINSVLSEMSELAYGFTFSSVIDAYWRGIKLKDDQLRQSALRWLRGEYSTKTEARAELPVDRIIDDQSWYDFIKLFALFVKKSGYAGLLIFLDEGVNLYKISHKLSRESNYEKLLTIFNDTMQGKAQHLGVFLSGTPQFVSDERRGLFSYEALRSRLSDNRFSGQGFVDYSGPVIRLSQLAPEEIYLLLERLCELHSSHYEYEINLGEHELTLFLNMVLSRMGADQLLTPREVTRDFIGLLNILHQNSDINFDNLVNSAEFSIKSAEYNPEMDDAPLHDLFTEFDI